MQSLGGGNNIVRLRINGGGTAAAVIGQNVPQSEGRNRCVRSQGKKPAVFQQDNPLIADRSCQCGGCLPGFVCIGILRRVIRRVQHILTGYHFRYPFAPAENAVQRVRIGQHPDIYRDKQSKKQRQSGAQKPMYFLSVRTGHVSHRLIPCLSRRKSGTGCLS